MFITIISLDVNMIFFILKPHRIQFFFLFFPAFSSSTCCFLCMMASMAGVGLEMPGMETDEPAHYIKDLTL